MTIRLFLRYDGSGFSGWQIQNKDGAEREGLVTVQGTLNKALRTLLCDDSIKVTGCSRTDAGVHALEYCASFEVKDSIVPPDRICRALTPLLPETLTVYRSEQAPDGFNARYDTVRKTYVYDFHCGEFPVPSLKNTSWFVKTPVQPDLALMNEAASVLLGTHRFDAFCGDLSNAKTTERTLYELRVTKLRERPSKDVVLYRLTATGDGFLYNMVRIIAGTLVDTGLGKLTPAGVEAALLSGMRKDAGRTAPPQGLFLKKIYLRDDKEIKPR
ncbi:MAG: tRNA pseudouridine(38-40) synthase TruA [Clostridia bacterium]|nr:tRNA pseudouridine(38-40) synthase TruA [Clostridia bacterium]